MKTLSVFAAASVLFVCALAAALPRGALGQPRPISVGGDVSFLQRVEDYGGRFFDGGVERDALEIFRDGGHDLMRLRLWHSPLDGYSGIDTTVALARRIVDAGHRWILDLHYSDSWADPGKQFKPAAWQDASFGALIDSVYEYSRRTLAVFRSEGILPDYVQIGNEITSGMLWPDGNVGGESDTPGQWDKLVTFVSAGMRGVRDGAAPDSIRKVIHIDRGADVEGATWFFDNLTGGNDDFDAIGLSYYPFWHGGIDRFQYNLEVLGERYGKEILVVEVAYPWTFQFFDNETNIVGSVDASFATWPVTPEGQADFLRETATVVRCSPTGSALTYWEPEHITSGFTSPWENMALFDENGEALPGLRAMADTTAACVSHYASVRMPLNVASIPDTVSLSALEVRGAVDGFAPFVLTDGRQLDWSDSRIELTHVGGDYFVAELLAPKGREVKYKFWSAAAASAGFNFGWDIGEANADPNGDSMLPIAADTLLRLHFFNAVGSRKPYDWRPWDPKPDSVAVWFRVYMRTYAALDQGYVGSEPYVAGPDITQPVLLARERNEEGTAGYDLYSGVVHFPAGRAGTPVQYDFCVAVGACEQGDARTFVLPSADTTLSWVYYDDSRAFRVGIEDVPASADRRPGLTRVWPNPARDAVELELTAAGPERMRFELFDVLGRRVAVLGERNVAVGRASLSFPIPPLPDGLYFIAASAGEGAKSSLPIVIRRN